MSVNYLKVYCAMPFVIISEKVIYIYIYLRESKPSCVRCNTWYNVPFDNLQEKDGQQSMVGAVRPEHLAVLLLQCDIAENRVAPPDRL